MNKICRAPWLMLTMALFLSACGGGNQPKPAAPAASTDPSLESARQLARFALKNAQHDQAVTLYARVLGRAYARDDAVAIGDIGYEYSLALLQIGNAEEAVKQARKIREELRRRDVTPFAELFLVESVAHYAIKQNGQALAMAEQSIRFAQPNDQATRGRANFILGMVAADGEDPVSLERAITAMGAPRDSALKADVAELSGRRLMLLKDAKKAIAEFERAAELRRGLREYSGMARSLAAAGAAANTTGNFALAADLYYRAGRSAAVQKDTKSAKDWLNQAQSLAVRHGLIEIELATRERLRAINAQ